MAATERISNAASRVAAIPMARLWRRDRAAAPAFPELRGQPLEFIAYAEASLISARIHFQGERLADMLNTSPVLVLEEVLLTSLTDGHTVELRTLNMERDDLCAIQALGPRGNEARRRRTRLYSVVIGVGPYEVRGGLHARPGVDPFHALRTTDLLALTDAEIEYSDREGTVHTTRAAALLVNRRKVAWVAPTRDEMAAMPELAYALDATSMAKDFTGELAEP